MLDLRSSTTARKCLTPAACKYAGLVGLRDTRLCAQNETGSWLTVASNSIGQRWRGGAGPRPTATVKRHRGYFCQIVGRAVDWDWMPTAGRSYCLLVLVFFLSHSLTVDISSQSLRKVVEVDHLHPDITLTKVPMLAASVIAPSRGRPAGHTYLNVCYPPLLRADGVTNHSRVPASAPRRGMSSIKLPHGWSTRRAGVTTIARKLLMKLIHCRG